MLFTQKMLIDAKEFFVRNDVVIFQTLQFLMLFWIAGVITRDFQTLLTDLKSERFLLKPLSNVEASWFMMLLGWAIYAAGVYFTKERMLDQLAFNPLAIESILIYFALLAVTTGFAFSFICVHRVYRYISENGLKF